MDGRAHRACAFGQSLGLADLLLQHLVQHRFRDVLPGVVVHLFQVRLGAQTPDLRQVALLLRREGVVQVPRHVRPARKAFAEIDLVRAVGAEHHHQFPRLRLLADRLGVQESRDNGLLDLAELEPKALLLDLARLLDLAFQDRLPVLPLALVLLRAGNRGQLARGIGQCDIRRRGQKSCWTNVG